MMQNRYGDAIATLSAIEGGAPTKVHVCHLHGPWQVAAMRCPSCPEAETNLETQAKAFMDAVCPVCMDLPGPPCGKCGNPFKPEAGVDR